MPVSTSSTPAGSSPRSRSRRTTSTPKPSSARKTLPTPATRILAALAPHRRLQLVGPEVAEPAVGELHLGRRIAVHGHRDVHAAVDVVHHGLHGGAHAGQEPVLGVAAAAGTQQHVAAPGHRHAADQHRVGVRVDRGVGARIPPRRVLGGRSAAESAPEVGDRLLPAAVPAGRIERIAPCSRSMISGGIASTASMIPAARGSVARASAFSSSVSTSVRRVRISSFSSPSNRLIVLSGASCGWSARMIGDESSRSARSAGPASTGQVCSLTHSFVNGSAHRGGSVSDRNAPAAGGEQRVRGDQRACAAPPRAGRPARSRRR